MRDYNYREAEIIVKEMMDQLCLDMTAQKLVTESVSIYISYSHNQYESGVKGTVKLASQTNIASVIVPAVAHLYRRIANRSSSIRRVCLYCNSVVPDQGVFQLNMFEDTTTQIKNKELQEVMLEIRARYGKNSILKGMNYEEAATGRERNMQIGGHKGGTV